MNRPNTSCEAALSSQATRAIAELLRGRSLAISSTLDLWVK